MTYSEVLFMRIESLCKKRGITLNGLATLSGVGQSTLDSIAKGKSKNPTMRTVHRIANFFNMTPSEFLDYPEMNAFSFDEEGQ